jgi:tetratricopeptide (TPR) repeat protein
VWKKKGDIDRALADFTQAAAYYPNNTDALYQAGYIWFTRQDYEKAIEYFSGAIAVWGDNADYRVARGVSYWSKSRRDKIGFWDEGGGIISLAEEDFTRAIECAPDMAGAYLDRGTVRCFKALESDNLIKAILTQKVTDDAGRALMLARLGNMGGQRPCSPSRRHSEGAPFQPGPGRPAHGQKFRSFCGV